MKSLNSFSLLLFFIFIIFVPTNKTVGITHPVFDHTHSIFDVLLRQYVHDGKVDYQGLKKNSKELEKYLNSLAKVTYEQYAGWTTNQKKAFWINAYNAHTLKIVIDNYPIKRSFSLKGIFYAPSNSILQIPGVWDKIDFTVAGRVVTLNDIEHKILRKHFGDPRIHMAINCASVSCPDLRDETYKPQIIDKQLDEASFGFVNNSLKGMKIDVDRKEVRISKIFKWFGEDFSKYENSKFLSPRNAKLKGVLGFLVRYTLSENNKKFLEQNNFKVSYFSYDWSLNDMKSR